MTDQTGNGYAFNLASSSQGISPYALLEAAWCLPAILYGIRNKIWIGEHSKTVVPHPVLVLWVEMGLLLVSEENGDDLVVTLTEGGSNVVAMHELFEYEFSMMIQQLDGDTETKPEKYKSLRGALGHFSDIYLEALVGWVIDKSDRVRILDFGGGDGHMLRKLLDSTHDGQNYRGSGVLLDKAPTMDPGMWDHYPVEIYCENFLEKLTLVREHPHEFDTIVVSEVLHCLNMQQISVVIPKLARLLAPGGKLFIIEQGQNFRLNWRLHDFTDGGFTQTPDVVREMFEARPNLELIVAEQIATATHHATVLTHEDITNATTH